MEYVTRDKLEYYRTQATELREVAAKCENPETARTLREAADYFRERFNACAPAHGMHALPEPVDKISGLAD
jgi:hypothetical protein